MNEVLISKKSLLIWLLVIALLVAAGLGYFAFQRFQTNHEVAQQPFSPVLTNTPDDTQLAQAAALAGAQAFYTVDAQAGQQVWLDRLCAVSTEIGCMVYQNVIGPNLWPKFEEANTNTSVEVGELEMVQEQIAPSRGNAPMQVWRMQVHISAPWVMHPEPITQFSALALVLKENGVWKFERFLTEEEIQAKFLPEVQP
jgi:hypothetical protein